MNTNSQSVDVIWDQIVVQTTLADDTRVNVGDNVEIRVTLWLAYDSTPLGIGDTVTLAGQVMTWDSGNSWFDLSVSQASVGLWTYYVNSSSESTHGINVLDTNSQSIDIIWDQIIVQTTVADDTRVNVGDNVEVRVTLWLAYDSAPLGSGDTVILAGQVMTWDSGNSWFDLIVSQASIGLWTYYVNSSSESTYGITALDTNSQTIDVIWDQIVVQTIVADDTRVNVGDNVEVRVTLWLAYDSTPLGSGDTVTLAGQVMTWDAGSSWFDLTVSQASVGLWTYFVNSSSQSTYGISALDTNGQSIDVIWDQIIVQTTVADDTRVNVGANVEVRVTLWLDYDDTFLGAGDSVSLDGTAMTWDSGNSWFDLTVSQTSVGLWRYFVNSSSQSTYGITVLDTNSQGIDVIWDQIVVQTTVADDTRVNIGNNVEIRVTLWLAYDNALLGSGDTVTLAGQAMTWDAVNFWFDLSVSQASVGLWSYFVNSSLETNYGISVLEMNGQSVDVIWDQIVVQTTVADDTRVNIGANVEVRVTLWLAYDSTPLGSGDTVTLAGQVMTWDSVNSWFDLTVSQASVGLWTYFVNSSTETNFGITVLDTNAQSVDVIWDQIVVQTTVADDTRVNIGTNVEVRVTLWLAYDSTPLGSGDTVTLAGQAMTWDSGNSWFDLTVSQASVGLWTYFVNSSSEDTYGITALDTNGQNIDIIWDQIVVQTTVADDTRVNVGANVEIRVTLWLAYDSTFLGSGDTVTLAGQAMTWDSGNSWFDLTVSQASVGLWTYFVNSSTEATYGITLLDLNSQNVDIIWDQIVVRGYSVLDDRVNINSNAFINVTLEYEYDDTDITDGTVNVNGFSAVHLDAGIWQVTLARSVREGITFDSVACSGNTYGISSVDQNGQSQLVIWDSLTITITAPTDQRINLNDNASGIVVTAMYDYDFTPYDGTLVLNSTIFAYGNVGRHGYTVASAVGDDAHGITAIRQNDETWCIWDQVVVVSYSTDDSRIGVGTPSSIHVTLEYAYDGFFVIDGTVSVNGLSAVYSGSNGVWDFGETRGTVQLFTYDSVEVSGNTYGISAIDQNGQSQDQIWDRVQVQSYVVDDSRANINDNVTIDVTLVYDYDNSAVTDGIVTVNGISALHIGSGVWRIIENMTTVQAVTYDTVACSGNLYGISQIDQNGQSQTVVWDEIVVRGYSVVDNRVDINTNVYIDVTLEFEYDDSEVTSGTVTINGVTAVHQGSGVWRITQSRSFAQGVTYDSVVCSGNIHGITTINQNLQSVLVIWDSVTISMTDPLDQRININANATGIIIIITYDYDSSLYDGTYNLNNSVFTYATAQRQGYNVTSVNGNDSFGITAISTFDATWCIWDSLTISITNPTDQRINIGENASGMVVTAIYDYDSTPYDGSLTLNNTIYTYGVVGKQGYKVATAAGNDAYGITAISLNDEVYCIWDQVVVVSYSSDDSRIDVGASSSCHVTLHYDYDDTFVVDGTVSVNGLGATYSGSNGVWDFGEVRLTVQLFTYNSVSVSANAYGISSIDQNGKSQDQIWDRVQVQSYFVVDSRVNVGDGVNIDVTLYYDFDDSFVFDGSVTINGLPAAYQGSGVWRATDSESVVMANIYNTIVVSGNTLGISVVDQNAQIQQVIWDRIVVRGYTVADDRVNLNDVVDIDVELEYEFDSTDVVDGTVTVNGESATYQASGIWRITVSESTVVGNTYNSVTCTGNSQGITLVNQNGQAQQVIWDQIIVLSVYSDDTRINVGAACSGHVTLQYSYDGTYLTDGTITVNDVVATYSGSSGIWDFAEARGTVQLFTYNSVEASGNTYGITSVNQNGQSENQIWDQLRVIGYSVTDSRCDVDSVQTVTAIVVYEYDSTLFTGARGTVYLTGSAMVWDGVLLQWKQDRTSSVVGRFVFGVSSITDTFYGISVFQTATRPAIIWDALIISITIADNHINVNEVASVQASATYAYDGTNYDGSLTLNNTQFSYPTAQIQWYTVSSAAGDGIYGITAIGTNDVESCIWDSLTIHITDPTDQRININTNASGIVVTATYDYDGSAYDGTLTLNNTVFLYPAAQKQGYRVTLAVGDDAFGITTISTNDETYCIWDSLMISMTDPFDQRININENASGIVVTAIYDYDSSPYSGTLLLNDTTFIYSTIGKRGYTVASAAGDDVHGISAISLNDETFCIWDQLLIVIAADSSNPYNGVQANFTMTVTFRYDGATCAIYQIAIARNNSHWHTFTAANVSLFVDTASDTIYDYNASSVNSEPLYGITSFLTNTERVSWSAAPNIVPTNDSAPLLTNADDTDNMYARYKYYLITSSVSDNDGAWDIDYVELTLYDDTRSQVIWVVRYTASTDSFTIQVGSAYITLGVGSSASVIGQTMSIVWEIKIDWDHMDLTNVDVKQYVTDGSDSDEDFYEVNWDIETRLEIIGLTVDDGSGTSKRGSLDGAFAISGTIRYSGSSLNPLSNETDVWVSATQYGTNVGPWSDLTLVSGFFSVTCFADDVVGQDTYTVIVVEEGSGSGGSSLLQSGVQDTYIADQVQVQAFSVLDVRVNVNDNVNIDVTLYYDYDDTPVTDGTVTINGFSATHQGSGVWRISDSESIVTAKTYNLVAYDSGTHGIDVTDQNGLSQDIVWDQVVVRGYSVVDDRVNIYDSINIDVVLEYEYDDTPVIDGTVTVNGFSATHQSSGVWRVIQSRDSVQLVVFNTVACSGNAFGISSVNQDGMSQSVIWDRVQVQSYDVVDNRVNLGVTVNIDVTLFYDYDNTPVIDGTVTVNGFSATHQSAGVWRITDSESSVMANTYNSVTCTGNSFDISIVDQNLQFQQVIWDQVTVRGYTASDTRATINDNVNIDVTIEYEYDDSPVTDGSVTINGMSASHQGSGVWRITDSESTVVQNLYDLVTCSGNLLGITDVNQDSQSIQIIWDRIIVISYSTDDGRININTAGSDHVTLRYEYDSSFVTDGTVTINGLPAMYSGANGIWNFGEVKSSAQALVYDTVAASGNVYDINIVNQNAQSLQQIWDSLTISITGPSDQRININQNASGIVVTAVYDYDGTSFDGVLTLNHTTYQFSTVGKRGYTVATALGDTYGITAISNNDETFAIWDSLSITITVTDPRISIGQNASIYVSAVYDYDGQIYDGTLTLNDTTYQYNTVGLRSYTISSAVGDTYGITVIGTNDVESIIWDRLRVTSYSVSDNRCNIGTSQTVAVVMIYEYDDVVFTGSRGTVYLNETSMTWDPVDYRWEQQRSSPTVGRFTFAVSSVTDTYHGISAFYTNGVPSIIWDSLTVSIIISDSRINIGQSASIQASAVYDYDGSTYDGTLNLNNTQLSYPTAQRQYYTVSSASGDDLYGITAISTNDIVYCIWDSLTISITGPTDQRININQNASGIVVTANYDYDGTSYDGTFILNNTVFVYSTAQRQGYRVATAVGDDSYGITVITTNDATFCIWDSLTITITDPVDQRININQNASGIIVTATYDYDSAQYSGTLNLNDTLFEYSTVGRRGYRVANAAGDDVYGITAISLNDETYCIWDRLHIVVTVDSSSPYNDIQVNFTLTITFEYDGAFCTTYQVEVTRNATSWHSFTDSNKTLFVDRNIDTVYDYIVSDVIFETQYGIVAFSTTSQRVSWSAAPNIVPTNDSIPVLMNADDTDNMYARYRFYTIVTNASDGDGDWDIDYIELTLYDNARTQIIWTVRYTVAGGTFTVESGSEYIELASWSSALVVANTISVTWQIKIDWDHSGLTNVDVLQYVTDGTDFDQDFYEVNWDVENQLAITGLTVDDDSGTNNRGSLDGSFTLSGIVSYVASSLNPRSNETDVWVSTSEYGTNIGPWSDLVLESGVFSVTCYADDEVGIDTYTVSVVDEGGGSGGTNLLQSVFQGTYIADRVQVQSYTTTDTRVDVSVVVVIDVTLFYDYDDTPVTSGIVTINGFAATHQGAGIWRISDTETIVTAVVYNLVTHIGGLHGVDVVDQNAMSLTVIWDKIVVRSYSAVDARVNINDDAFVDVTIEYEYDDSPVEDGTVTINGLVASNLGLGVWRITDSESLVTANTYNTVACTGNSFGITVVDQNSQSLQVIWDQITVSGYTASDTRANVNDNVNIDVTLKYEYDDSPVTDGIITINGMSALHQGSGVWRITESESTVVQNLYNLVTCSGNLFGITNVNQNAQSQTIIWDRVIVMSYSTDDSRININTAAGDHVTLRYEYDSSPVTDGIVTVNGVAAVYSGANGIWNFGDIKTTAQSVIYDLAAVSGNLYGISVVNQNAQSLQQIWDSLTISITDPTDQRINLNENASGIIVTAIYNFDSSAYDGFLILNDTIFQYSTVGRRGYEVQSAGGDTHGITAIAFNDQTYAIWDSLSIAITVTDPRIGIGQNASIYVSAIYNYDGQTYDGTLTLNDTTYLYSTVGLRSYTVSSAVGDTYGITVIGTND
ncbi:MAG: hypothetical protein AM325_013390, partial [Candidatus Thorarchaeota archaeon SMTZ1-45]